MMQSIEWIMKLGIWQENVNGCIQQFWQGRKNNAAFYMIVPTDDAHFEEFAMTDLHDTEITTADVMRKNLVSFLDLLIKFIKICHFLEQTTTMNSISCRLLTHNLDIGDCLPLASYYFFIL